MNLQSQLNDTSDETLFEASAPLQLEPFVFNGYEYLHQITPLQNEAYSLLVEGYAFGQMRIRLTDLRDHDPYAPEGHGGIVRELCTYEPMTAFLVLQVLSQVDDPEEKAHSLAHTMNCDHPHGRIRLDTPWPHATERCSKCDKHMSDFETRGCTWCSRRP